MKKLMFAILALIFLGTASSASALEPIEELGKAIFFDQKLSVRNNQSCASCHAPSVGWTGPIPGFNKAGSVYFGSVRTRFGNRKPPTVAYGGDSPVLYYDGEAWIGGMFWDGRATGSDLGDPLAEQALGPFLNPLEQALPNASYVVDRVCSSKYSDLFKNVWGSEACTNVADAYDNIGRSIAAYERSSEVSQFSSKYDAYLNGKASLTAQELRGLELFNDNEKGKCSACHISEGLKPLFTDFTYDNLGVPRNPQNPFYFEPEWNPDGLNWVDNGLGGFLESIGEPDYALEMGKQKVPSLRNVDKRPGPGFVKAYGHNGYFKSLESIVNFYNTRDVKLECPDPFTTEADALSQGCWPAPEVADNVNTEELGDLGLSADEEAAIVAFLKTLSDGYTPKK
ncbi:cytochrome-c peroxidase [Desulfococcus sp.]|uniref:cytochrome-c peroxidase n=1 Tax=Desulfococcus sp. TaxID=2025834 RepID=UPI003593E2BC